MSALILDTNVISELMRNRPDPRVLRWLDAQPLDSLFTTAIAEAEIRTGIAMLAAGRRRTALAAAADQLFQRFDDRILPFDSPADRRLRRHRRTAPRRGAAPVAQADNQIAAIARSRKAAVVTRNTGGLRRRRHRRHRPLARRLSYAAAGS